MFSNRPSAVCFGEILWDVLPDASMPGGAPMNVAYHLNKLGINSTLISRVGNDEPGKKLLELLESWQLSAEYCQIDQKYRTSEVIAAVGDNHEVTYDILYPVAWDNISFEQRFELLLKNADALVFGSLITRNIISADTLRTMIDIANYKVFDINLRAPHYSANTIKQLLLRTNLLKLNVNELTEVAGWYNSSAKTDEECIRFFQDEFNIEEIIVTKGSKGSSYYTPFLRLDHVAYKVEVADTIGSGDSFLAGFLAKKLQRNCTDVSVSYASALGAYVTQHHGACPDYTIEDIEQFKSEKATEMHKVSKV